MDASSIITGGQNQESLAILGGTCREGCQDCFWPSSYEIAVEGHIEEIIGGRLSR